MSSLENVTEALNKGCFCHNGDLKYMFECMPTSISHGTLTSDCKENTYCYHGKEKDITHALQEFKKFMETKGRFKVGDHVEIANTPSY